MTPADRALLANIATAMNEKDDRQAIDLMRAYWGDADRADRTGREWLYLHLGYVSGFALRLLDQDTP